MKCDWKKLALAVAIPLAVGGLSAVLTMDNMIMFDAVKKPPLSPPKWLFPAAWTEAFPGRRHFITLKYFSGDRPFIKRSCVRVPPARAEKRRKPVLGFPGGALLSEKQRDL